MSDLVLHRAPGSESQAIALPEPRMGAINIRPAVLGGADYAFIDALQKKHNKMVGFMKRPVLESNIKNGHVLIAEDPATTERLGYVIAHDKYLKREELGIVYHLNVVPGKWRGLIGASLVKAVFDRAAYGCKLFCCWCAQDLEANYFWESVGFVPIAFRTGSRGKANGGRRKDDRIHIFWQRRIREGDDCTAYWFPSETHGGAMKEARIVLPIPPGTHWSDAKPTLLPGMEKVNTLQIEGKTEQAKEPKPREKKVKAGGTAVQNRPKRGLWFAPPAPPEPTSEEKQAAKAKERAERPRMKNDPKVVEAARELRDRYIEQINQGLLLPPAASGKYDVSRQLEAAATNLKALPQLKAA